MCGIAGYLRFDGQPATRERAARMVATLRHRGPDDSGVFTRRSGGARRGASEHHRRRRRPSAALGRRRRDHRRAERRDLQLRRAAARARVATARRFATSCDTEVIGHLYARERRTRIPAAARHVRGRRSGIVASGSWCWRAIASARSRSTTASGRTSCCSARKRRRFSPSLDRRAGRLRARAAQLPDVRVRRRRRFDLHRHVEARARHLDEGVGRRPIDRRSVLGVAVSRRDRRAVARRGDRAAARRADRGGAGSGCGRTCRSARS